MNNKMPFLTCIFLDHEIQLQACRIITITCFNSGDRSVFIVSRLWNGQSGVRILVDARGVSLLQNVPTGSGTQPASYSMATVVLCRG